ncbi:MAG: pyridoxal phosphate-dependent aminotransferase [Burkholderiales bacterium]
MNTQSPATPPLSPRVAGIAPSATVEMSERIRKARAEGKEILPLASGDPNLDTPPEIIEAAHRAMRDGSQTRYGPAQGLPALREAIAARIARRSGAHYAADEIIVTPGGKFAVYMALMGTVSPGDEVIVLDPGWVSYGPCVQLAGGTPVFVPALDRIPLDQVAAAVTAKTRAIILNSPCNPTGRIIPQAELKGLLAIAERHNLWLLFDQVYSDLCFEAFSFLQTLPGAQARTLVCDSFSKTYGMTGWRIGFLAAPKAVIKPLMKVVQHSIYCVPPFLQSASVAALALPEEMVAVNAERFRRRQHLTAETIAKLPGFSCPVPPATFYVFPSVGDRDDKQVAEEWLTTLGIAVLPGSAFGAAGAGHLRLSLACDDATLAEAMRRLRAHYAVA